MKDPSTPLRSLTKGLSWRVISTIIIVANAWIFTGSLAIAGKIGLAEFFVKLGLFYIHERVWHQIPFGKRLDDPPAAW